MIDENRLLLAAVPVTPQEALRMLLEMKNVLNSLQVQLRERGTAIGEPGEPDTVGQLLLQAWGNCYHAANAMRLVIEAERVADAAPIWTGDEPPLDQPPSPV